MGGTDNEQNLHDITFCFDVYNTVSVIGVPLRLNWSENY
jgi:hypothetical protein